MSHNDLRYAPQTEQQQVLIALGMLGDTREAIAKSLECLGWQIIGSVSSDVDCPLARFLRLCGFSEVVIGTYVRCYTPVAAEARVCVRLSHACASFTSAHDRGLYPALNRDAGEGFQRIMNYDKGTKRCL